MVNPSSIGTLILSSPSTGNSRSDSVVCNCEFATDRFFNSIAESINTCTFRAFVCESGAFMVNMENIICIHYKEDSSEFIEGVESTRVLAQFYFSNRDPITMAYSVNLGLISDLPSGTEKMSGLLEATVQQYKEIGKVLIFSNGMERLIINRRFFTHVTIDISETAKVFKGTINAQN